MKKKLFLTLYLIAVMLLTACSNYSIIDTTWNFDYAYVNLGNDNIIEGKIESWKDYTDSDMVQVKIAGKTYYTHGSNIILVSYQSKENQHEQER